MISPSGPKTKAPTGHPGPIAMLEGFAAHGLALCADDPSEIGLNGAIERQVHIDASGSLRA